MILAQYVAAGSLAQLVIMFIVVVAILAIGAIVLRNSGISIPAWVFQIFWIVILVVVGVFAIRFLVGWA